MQKLLNTYRAAPTLDNAKRIVAYDRKHPMAQVMLTQDDAITFGNAVYHVKTN